MVRPSQHPSPQNEAQESDALRYWRAQEDAPLPALSEAGGPMAAAEPARDGWPSGWWILPVLILSCLAWGCLGAAVLF